MSHSQLMRQIAGIQYRANTEYGFLLYPAGVKGLFHLGQENVYGLHLIDANPQEVLAFVSNVCEGN